MLSCVHCILQWSGNNSLNIVLFLLLACFEADCVGFFLRLLTFILEQFSHSMINVQQLNVKFARKLMFCEHIFVC